MFRPYPTASIPFSASSHADILAAARRKVISPERLMQQIVDDWLARESHRPGRFDAFFADVIVPDAASRTPAESVYVAYCSWCAATNTPLEGRNAVGRALRAAGYSPLRAAGGRRMWGGVRLAKSLPDPVSAQTPRKAIERDATNAVDRFFTERASFSSQSVTPSCVLYAAWVEWSRGKDIPKLSHRAFSLAVKAAGVEGRRVRGHRSWVGIALRDG